MIRGIWIYGKARKRDTGKGGRSNSREEVGASYRNNVVFKGSLVIPIGLSSLFISQTFHLDNCFLFHTVRLMKMLRRLMIYASY